MCVVLLSSLIFPLFGLNFVLGTMPLSLGPLPEALSQHNFVDIKKQTIFFQRSNHFKKWCSLHNIALYNVPTCGASLKPYHLPIILIGHMPTVSLLDISKGLHMPSATDRTATFKRA